MLESGHEKVDEDSRRLVTLARDLRDEASQQEEDSLSPTVLERIRKLEKQARELREAVENMDANILSLKVVNGAHRIREEAKSLRKLFEESPSRGKLRKLRRLAREVEKRADSVYDHARNP